MPDYDTMEAGRELDALVAEKVMGWKRDISTVHLQWEHPPNRLRTWFQTSFGRFQPSLYIEDAWEVVEKMETLHGFDGRGMGGRNGFLLTKYGKSGLYYCEFPSPNWMDDEAPTAPLAICRAALKAVGK